MTSGHSTTSNTKMAVHVVHKYSVLTSKKTQQVSITKTNRFTLLMENPTAHSGHCAGSEEVELSSTHY